MLKKVFLTVTVVNFLALNIAVGFLVYKEISTPEDTEIEDNDPGLNDTDTSDRTNFSIGSNDENFVCDADCQKLIEEKIANVLPSYLPSVTVKPQSTIVPPSAKTKFVSYIPIPGSGNTTNTNWTDLAGTEFSFSIGDYVGFKEAYFEANMKLFNGNGVAYLRLYDITNSRAVDGSEISTSSQSSVAVSSGRISLWQGNNRYKIQARSLTADTTYFESGRLKIINEQ